MKLFSVFLIHILLYEKSITIRYSVTTIRVFEYYWVFLNSLNNPKFGASQNLKILVGIPPLDDPMTNLPKKNGWNSLQPPEMELQSLVPTESPSWHHISSRSPGHIHQRIWACHTSLERSRIAFYGYVNFWSPNQTIWWPGAIEGFWR